MDTYDYIITGGGSAGCVLANRLSADPSVRVLLLEAGGSDRHPFFHMPAGFAKMTKGIGSWGWSTVPQRHMKNRVLGLHPGQGDRRRVLDQRTDLHARHRGRLRRMGAQRGRNRLVLPRRAAVLPNARKTISATTNEFHGYGGPMGVSNPISPLPICEAYFQAGQELGIPFNPDFNGERQEGLGYYQLTQCNARRSSTSVAYLAPVRQRKNLTVALRTLALRVVVEGGRAVGVEMARREAARPACCAPNGK